MLPNYTSDGLSLNKAYYQNNSNHFLFTDSPQVNRNFLINEVNRMTYPTDYTCEVPCYRYRATYITKTKTGGFEITAVQKNFAMLQGNHVTLPTIVLVNTDNDLSISDIELFPDFCGSKGKLCDYNYLATNIKKKLTGKIFSLQNIKVDQLHCFHLEEVLLAAYSLLNGLINSDKQEIYEEEISLAHDDNGTISIPGQHYISTHNKLIDYTILYKDGLTNIDFTDSGEILIKEHVPLQFYFENTKVLENELLPEDKATDIFYKTIYMNRHGIQYINENALNNCSYYAYNSNLSYKAFIGLFIQVMGLKKYQHNLEKTITILETLQRKNNIPQCIGGIHNSEEKTKYFGQ